MTWKDTQHYAWQCESKYISERKWNRKRKEGRVCRDAKVDINRDMIKSSHRAKTIKSPSIGNGVQSEGNSSNSESTDFM